MAYDVSALTMTQNVNKHFYCFDISCEMIDIVIPISLFRCLILFVKYNCDYKLQDSWQCSVKFEYIL